MGRMGREGRCLKGPGVGKRGSRGTSVSRSQQGSAGCDVPGPGSPGVVGSGRSGETGETGPTRTGQSRGRNGEVDE